jgi:hypothetical protein
MTQSTSLVRNVVKVKSKLSGDIIRFIFIIMIFILVGPVSAYTHEQQTVLDGMNLSYKFGIAYEKAIQERNVADYNNLVDIYNAWIRQVFGEGASALFKSKITTADLLVVAQNPQVTTEIPSYQPAPGVINPYYQVAFPPGVINPYVTKRPFNASSELGKFGKQQVRTDLMGDAGYIEAITADRVLRDFLYP